MIHTICRNLLFLSPLLLSLAACHTSFETSKPVPPAPQLEPLAGILGD